MLAALLLGAVLAPQAALAQERTEVLRETEVRSDPDDATTVVAILEDGDVVNWLGRSGAWYRVSGIPGLAEDEVGYIRAADALSPARYREVVEIRQMLEEERRREEERRQRAAERETGSSMKGLVYLVLLVGLGAWLAELEDDSEDALTHDGWGTVATTGAVLGFSQLPGTGAFQAANPSWKVTPHISVSPIDSRLSVGLRVVW